MKNFIHTFFSVALLVGLLSPSGIAQNQSGAIAWTQTPAMGDVVGGPWNAADNPSFLTLSGTQGFGYFWVSAVLLSTNTPYIIQLTLGGETVGHHKLSQIGITTQLRGLSFNPATGFLKGAGEDKRIYSMSFDQTNGNGLQLHGSIDLSSHISGNVVGMASDKVGNGGFWVIEMYNPSSFNSILKHFKENGTQLSATDISGMNAFGIDRDAHTGMLWIAGKFGSDIKYLEFNPDTLQATGNGFNSTLQGTPTSLSISHDPRNDNGLSMLSHVSQDNGSGNNPVGQLILFDHNDLIVGNQSTNLRVFGLAIGKVAEIVFDGATPGRLVYLVGSPFIGTNSVLNELTNETNDTLGVQGPFEFGNIHAPVGTVGSHGEFSFNHFVAPNSASVELGEPFYIQAFTGDPNASGADIFSDFSNVFTVYPNLPGRWNVERDITYGPMTPGGRRPIYQIGINGGVEKGYSFGGADHMYPADGSPVHPTDEIWHMDYQTKENILIGHMAVPRSQHKIQKMPDGRYLISGGFTGPQGNKTKITRRAEIFDPNTGEIKEVARMATARAEHFSFPLPNGSIFVGGGVVGQNGSGMVSNLLEMLHFNTNTSEIYNPATDSWYAGPNLPYPLAGTQKGVVPTTALRIFFGGMSDGELTDRVFSINTDDLSFMEWTPMLTKRAFFGKARATTTSFLLSGGVADLIGGQNPNVIAESELYDISGTTPDGAGGFTYGSTAATDPIPEPMGFMSLAGLLRPDANGNKTVHLLGGTGAFRGSGGKHYTFNAGQTAGNQYQGQSRSDSDHSGGSVVTTEDGTVTVTGGDSEGAGENTAQTYTPE